MTLPTNRTTANTAAEHVSDHNTVHGFYNTHPTDPAGHSGTYVSSDPTLTITYNANGSVATITESGILTTFTYNTDGTVATSVRLGVTRTYTYSGGNLVGVA